MTLEILKLKRGITLSIYARIMQVRSLLASIQRTDANRMVKCPDQHSENKNCLFEGVEILGIASMAKHWKMGWFFKSKVSREFFNTIGPRGLLKIADSTMKKDVSFFTL